MEDRDKKRFKVFLGSTALHTVLGTCDRLRTASGAVKNNRLRGIGFNGSVSGLSHCDDVGHLIIDGHCLRTLHGEENLILNTEAKHLEGAAVIVIGTPCLGCIKKLVQAGVEEVHYVGLYDNATGREYIEEIAKQKDVVLIRHDIDFAELFQGLFDEMAKKGGVLQRAGYKLKVIKEEVK